MRVSGQRDPSNSTRSMVGPKSSSPSPLEIQSWLEWAGGRMLSIQVHGAWPSAYRSFWPDYPDDQITAYGYTPSRMRAPALNGSALNNRHLYSWAKIAVLIHSERRAVKLLHKKGLETIAQSVPEPTLQHFRSVLSSGPSLSA